MSKILGIICEYNPFHNGHLYHIKESKKLVNPDYTVAVMSGNFTQRGDTAIVDKWARAEMALRAGIDLVIELPLVYSISSAENFAQGSIKILNQIQKDMTLSFGTECGDINILEDIANVIIKEPPKYKSILKHELDKGLAYPKARENAVLMYLNDIRKYANVLSCPNNILAIEYIKALKYLKSKMEYISIKRFGVDYNSTSAHKKFASATLLREMFNNGEDFSNYIPKSSYNVMQNRLKYGQYVNSIKSFEKEILFKLRTMSIEKIADIQDVSEGLENKIKKAADSCNTLDELIEKIKSKRYTLTRINRILLYCLFDITKLDILESYKKKPYIRVLGMNENGRMLISTLIKNNKNLPVITSLKKFEEKNTNKFYQYLLEKDTLATDIYTLGYKNHSMANLDYTKKLIIL